MKNYQIILIAIISFGLGWSIINGTAQQYVHFAGPMNEMACTLVLFVMGMGCVIGIDYRKLLNGLN